MFLIQPQRKINYETAIEMYDALSAPFPAEEIEWRVGSTNADKTKGMALAYIDARSVMDRLDIVCGIENWQDNYTPGVGGSIVCNIGIRMPNGDWVWKADGAGATDFEGDKGALSDAFKRAAVRFGIGRYLYSLKSPWVAVETKGKSTFIPDAERKKLNDIHEEYTNTMGWGVRPGIQAYKLLNQAVKHFVTSPADAIDFREKNTSMIAQLPAGMRRHLESTLDRIGGTNKEVQDNG